MFATILVALAGGALAHGRWKCPSPRDANDANGQHIAFDNTGNKWGACGPYSGMWGMGEVTALKPGWQTLVFEESINHPGSPFRIAILDENEDAKIILLDHIPHNDAADPNMNVESSYEPYQISVNVPDVACDKCSLQLLYVMTDKTTKCGVDICYYDPADSACSGHTSVREGTCAGAPTTTPCTAEDLCFSNYHSCSDVTISGKVPISEATFGQPADWPYASMQESYYGREVGNWVDGWLAEAVPSNYTTYFPSIC